MGLSEQRKKRNNAKNGGTAHRTVSLDTAHRTVSLELPKGLTRKNLEKRPSIAPVPAVLDPGTVEIYVESESDSDIDEDVDRVDGGTNTLHE